jgi:hypothetical protein
MTNGAATRKTLLGGGSIIAAAMTAVLAAAPQARAGNPTYGVSTIAGIYQYGGAGEDNDRAYNPQYFYNVVGGQYPAGYPAGPYAPGDTGVYSHSGAAFSSLALAGSTDTTGNLTSAFDSISGIDSNGGPASAYAGANLANASLHATAAGTYEGVYEGEDYYSGGGSQADFYDNLTFHVAGAGANTVTDITMLFKIDGSATTDHDILYGSQFMGLNYSFGLGGTNFNQGARWAPQTGGTGVEGASPVYIDDVSINSGAGNLQIVGIDQIADTPEDTELKVTYQLTGSSITAGVFDGLSLGCLDGVSCDWANTSSVSFDLPTNVTLTSASGDFLTAAGGVPEPASWAMMIVGMGALGAGLRKKRGRAAGRPFLRSHLDEPTAAPSAS